MVLAVGDGEDAVLDARVDGDPHGLLGDDGGPPDPDRQHVEEVVPGTGADEHRVAAVAELDLELDHGCDPPGAVAGASAVARELGAVAGGLLGVDLRERLEHHLGELLLGLLDVAVHRVDVDDQVGHLGVEVVALGGVALEHDARVGVEQRSVVLVGLLRHAVGDERRAGAQPHHGDVGTVEQGPSGLGAHDAAARAR